MEAAFLEACARSYAPGAPGFTPPLPQSKTTKPRALSGIVVNFHVNFSLLPHWQALPTTNTPHIRSILAFRCRGQTEAGGAGCERPRAHPRLALPAPTSPQPQSGHTWAPVYRGGAAGTVPRSSHGAVAISPGAGSFISLFNNAKAPLKNRHRGASPALLKATGAEGQRGAGAVTQHHQDRGSPRSLCGGQEGKREAAEGKREAAPLTMFDSAGSV